jgi:hypothetical protein
MASCESSRVEAKTRTTASSQVWLLSRLPEKLMMFSSWAFTNIVPIPANREWAALMPDLNVGAVRASFVEAMQASTMIMAVESTEAMIAGRGSSPSR